MIAVNDYIIIRKDHPREISNGIILPFEKLETNGIGEPYTGVVESVGDMVGLVKKNDRVVFNDLCQPWIIEDGRDMIIVIKESDIISILEDE